MFDSGLSPERPGNTKELPAASSRARVRIARLGSLKGTRCSRLAFIRVAGTVHNRLVTLISFQRAPSTSPTRAAVRVKNSKAS